MLGPVICFEINRQKVSMAQNRRGDYFEKNLTLVEKFTF